MAKIAFDLDGTLITCKSRQLAVLRAAIAGRTDLDYEVLWEQKRAGASTIEALISSGIPNTLANSIASLWGQMIENPAWLLLDSIIEGVEQTLESLKRQGKELILLTARSRPEWLHRQLAFLRLNRFFNEVRIVSSKQPLESKSKILLLLAPELFLGDTESDFRASSQANVPFVGVASGQRSEAYLKECGVLMVLPSIASVPEFPQ